MTGKELKTLRKQAGLTQTELGQEIGTSYPVLSNWENGKQKISNVYQKVLTDYFNNLQK